MSCPLHAQGRCRRTACKFSHDDQGAISMSTQANEGTESSLTNNRPSRRKRSHRRKGQQHPNQLKAAGPQVQRTISERPASENTSDIASVAPSWCSKGSNLKDCHTRKVGTSTTGAGCCVLHEHVRVDHPEQSETEATLAAQARATEIAKEAAAKTVQSVVLGSIATFGAGLELSHVVTGFECSTLRIANLPPDVRKVDITTLLMERGLDQNRFHVVSTKPMGSGGKLSAEIITDAESGKAFSLDLNGLRFRGEILTPEVSSYNSPGSIPVETSQELTICWRGPSVCYIAEYPATVTATERAQELNSRVCARRRVSVKAIHGNSIKIRGLPPSVTDEEVSRFSGSDLVRRLLVNGEVSVEEIATTLRDDIEHISPGTLRSMEPPLPTNIDGVALVRAQFTSWDDAHAVRNSLRRHRIGNVSFWFRLPNPNQYSTIISAKQFAAQKSSWVGLVDSIRDKDSCTMHFHDHGAVVRVRLSGSKKEAVGALKVRVESLIAGEKVDGWHRTLKSSGSAFMRSVFDDTGALLCADWRREILKLYGQPEAVEQARELIKAELHRLLSTEYTRVLAKDSVQFFVQHGIQELKKTFGEDNVRFDISTRKITICGGEEVRHILQRLIKDSRREPRNLSDMSGRQSCPICHDNVSIPLRLSCGHIYCAACMRHCLTSALDTRQFPLTCAGDGSQCRVPFPIPIIQQILPPTSLERLLEVAFNAHITRNPQVFKYCKTPGCNQIYRSTDAKSATVVRCPSCFLNVCTLCHADVQEGLSCDGCKKQACLAKDRQMGGRIAAQGGRKKCPSRRVLMKKVDGLHICWERMSVCNADTTNEHMHDDHGIIHGKDPVDDHVDDWLELQVRFEEMQMVNEVALATRRDGMVRRNEAAWQAGIVAKRKHAEREQARQLRRTLKCYRRTCGTQTIYPQSR